MSRRIDGQAVALLWRGAGADGCGEDGRPALVAFVDGKPLPIGGNGKDPDARFGRGAGCVAKGYKLHTVWSNRAMPEAWEVTPLNRQREGGSPRQLIGRLDHGGYLLADGNYDASYLYDAALGRGGYQACGRRAARPRRRAAAATTRARIGCGVWRSCKGISARRCSRRGRGSSGASATPRRSPAAWGRCRHGSAGWRGCGRGSGPSCSSTLSASATANDLRSPLQNVGWGGWWAPSPTRLLRGWVRYFAVGDASRCFGFVKDWVEKKVRRPLMRARGLRGFGWDRWRRRWLYDHLGAV